MKDNTNIKLRARWDKSVVPADTARKRGLLIDVMGISDECSDRKPVNLALVIDRSGSMSGAKIKAAKAAARGVVARLGDEDVLSVVDFDSEITTLLSGVRLDRKGRKKAMKAIGRLSARGSTNLAGGWLEGATQAAKVIERTEFAIGHVVLLSDGHANVGIQDPNTLRAHADEMASRGVTTSTVGVGNGYSPLQLEALSEGGLGRLHDAGTPEEMIETILGELGEVVSQIATDVRVKISWPRSLGVKLLADYRKTRADRSMTVRLGQLLGGSKRTLPVMVDVPPLSLGEEFAIKVSVAGRDPETGESIRRVKFKARLESVTAAEARAASKDLKVAERIARLWESTLGLDAMRLNEQGDFLGSAKLVRSVGEALEAYAAPTAVAGSISGNLRRTEQKVGRKWDGRSKREALIAAKKFSKGEQDHRSGDRGDWSDHL